MSCLGALGGKEQKNRDIETPVEFEPFRFGHQQVFCLFTVF